MAKEINNLIFHMIRQLIQEHTALWQKWLPNVTKQQYSVLMAVWESPGIEQKDLIDAAVSTKATLAELLSRMEHRGLISRKQGEHDRRRMFINLTEVGEHLLKSSRPIAERVDEKFLSRISTSSQDELCLTLKTLLGREKI